MRISDWSSDVCSSDLRRRHPIRPSVCAGPSRRLPRGRPIPEAFPMDSSMLKFIFGRLTLDALPLHEPILVATFAVVALGGVALFGALTYFRLWGYLWKEWFTSVDPKKIGKIGRASCRESGCQYV